MDQKEVNEIDLLELAQVLLQKLWIILLCTILLGGIGFFYGAIMKKPLYTSTTKVYVLSKAQGESAVTTNDLSVSTLVSKDFVQIIKSRGVLQEVIDDLKLEYGYGTLNSRVSVANVQDTRILSISVSDPNPKLAQKIAEKVEEISAEKIVKIMNIDSVNVVDKADLPMSPSTNYTRKFGLLLAMVGLVLSSGVVILRYVLDDSIKTPDDVEKYLGLSTLSSIPDMTKKTTKKTSKKRK